MLEGILVDLVPYGSVFEKMNHAWDANESSFWSSAGNRNFSTHASLARRREWRDSDEGARYREISVPFGIQSKDGKPLGYMGINWMVPHLRLAMLGARIGEPDYWGGGYGTDALILLIDYAFSELDMRKVWLGTTDFNARVKRQMEKVGLQLEACQRESTWADGVWYDELLYGMLREEWSGREALVAKLGIQPR